jgi:hypothetical protein
MPEGEGEFKKRGDFLMVCLSDFEFGQRDGMDHQIIEWEDAALEAKLEAMKAVGKRPIIIYPYAEYEETANGGEVMVQRSTKALNVDTLDNAKDIKDTTKEVSCLKYSDISSKIITRDSLLMGE